MVNLLCVDFDYFFHNRSDFDDPQWQLYDWGHAESLLFIEMLWPIRAAGFLSNGLELPGTTGREVNFWDRFTFSDDASLYAAESNAMAGLPEVADDVDEVWLYDAHHDAGYHDRSVAQLVSEGRWSCENWMILYAALGATLHVRYPTWRRHAFSQEPAPLVPVDRAFDNDVDDLPVFDRVFVCRSGAWVPPWLDDRFTAFLERCPVRVLTELGSYPLTPREFSLDAARRDADHMAQLMGVSTDGDV